FPQGARIVSSNKGCERETRHIGQEKVMADIASSAVARQNSNWSYPSPHAKEQRVNQNRNIQKEAAVSNVVEVILDILVDKKSSVCAQLPQTGDPGNDLESLPLLGGIVLHDEGHLRPGSHQGHI